MALVSLPQLQWLYLFKIVLDSNQPWLQLCYGFYTLLNIKKKCLQELSKGNVENFGIGIISLGDNVIIISNFAFGILLRTVVKISNKMQIKIIYNKYYTNNLNTGRKQENKGPWSVRRKYFRK